MKRLCLLLAASYAYAANAPNVTGIAVTFHDGQTFLTWTDGLSGVSTAARVNNGVGYNNVPTLTASGGGGTGATLTATVSGGSLTGVTITNAGSGYLSAPTITVTPTGGDTPSVTAVVTVTLYAANYRYDIYWSLVPIIDPTTLSAATFLQEAFNNSGQIVAAGATWNQTTRQNGALPMSITAQGSCGGSPYVECGTALAAFTGLAVHTATATANAYYAVITHDHTNTLSDSPVSVGNNTTTSSVSESVGTALPLKVYDSHDTVNRAAGGSTVTISGTTGLPLWLNLAGSGGCTDYKDATISSGDLYQFWGDSTMGYQEGVQQMFTVAETHSGSTYGVPSLYMNYCDQIWLNTGLGSLETTYSGYAWPNVNTFQTYTEAELTQSVNWAIAHYSANPNKIYQTGQSAGGYAGDWAIRHPGVFAAVFDSASEWQRQVAESLVTDILISPVTTSLLMAGTGQQYLTRFDMAAYISAHCAGPLPFIAFAVGRNDVSRPNQWTANMNMLAALQGCHAGFTFAFNNGTHSDGATALNASKATYQTSISKNVSYPAFLNDSADNVTSTDCSTGVAAATPSPQGAGYNHVPTLTVVGTPGSGASLTANISGGAITSVTVNAAGSGYLFSPTVTVTPTGGDTPTITAVVTPILAVGSTCQINGGFSWTAPSETSTAWSSAISNTGATLTVDVTPRNTQAFTGLVPGGHATWTASTGQNGTATVDAYGLVTAPGITINSGAATTLSFNYTAPVPLTISGKTSLTGTVVAH